MKNADVYKHKKTGKEYVVLDLLTNCTNKDDGDMMVSYKSMDLTKKDLFVREIKEFEERFDFVRNLYDTSAQSACSASQGKECSCSGNCERENEHANPEPAKGLVGRVLSHCITIKKNALGFALTECPHGKTETNYKGSSVPVKVGSLYCYRCDHFEGVDEKETSISCTFSGEAEMCNNELLKEGK